MNWFLIFLILIICLFDSMLVILDKESEEQLLAIIKNFESNPQGGRYGVPFQPSEAEFKHLIHLMIWCPIRHYSITLFCPVDGTPLHPTHWNSVLTANNNRNPRLAFGLFINILFIQCQYRCNHGHNYTSSDVEIISMLPTHVVNAFPFRKYCRSMFTFQLIDYIMEQITHGMNFQQITESISSLHLKEFRNLLAMRQSIKTNEFYNSILTSYPSRDKVQEVFLDVFKERKEEYNSAVFTEVKSTLCLSTDHTFKVGKNVGGHRAEDHKFIKDTMKLFIVLDDQKRVVGWKLTKSTSHQEIKDVLCDIFSRLENADKLKYVMVDNCCESRQFYQSIFTNIPIKLDLFHAVQRLTQVLPNKFSAKTRKISNEIGLIFRCKHDRGTVRYMGTPKPQEMLANIEYFMSEHADFIDSLMTEKKKEFYKAIENIKGHIIKDCISDIYPGHGTEANEVLHRLLNYSCIRGVSNISPELMLALLTVLFYSYNKKIGGIKHICNSKVIPIPPVRKASVYRESIGQTETTSIIPNKNHGKENFVAQLHHSVIQNLANDVSHVFHSLNQLEESCKKRNFDVIDVLKQAFRRSAFRNEENNLDHRLHSDRLERNCASFGVLMQDVDRDGDCLFRSIIKQIKSLYNESDNNWTNHLNYLKLFLTDEDHDIDMLRSLFVSELETNSKYSDFLLNDDVDLQSYRKRGVFASNIGDFVADACSNILRVPIVILTSHCDMSVEVFFPTNQLADSPLIIAYNCVELHYMDTSTHVIDCDSIVSNRCHCSSTQRKDSCFDISCPCVKTKQGCNIRCKCKSCQNDKEAGAKPIKGCRCGLGSVETGWCSDKRSRRTKCKCFKARQPCSSECKCRNCCNDFGTSSSSVLSYSNVIKKSRPRPHATTYQKKRTTSFLQDQGQEMSEGSWTKLETATIFCCIHTLKSLSFEYNEENVWMLYDLLYKNRTKELLIRKKTIRQVTSKLNYMAIL